MRNVFISALFAALTLSPGLAHAAPAPAADGLVADGVYRLTYGDLTIFALSDKLTRLGFSVVQGLDSSAIKELVGPSPEIDGDSLAGYINCFLVQGPAGLILVDAGVGEADALVQSLKKAGFSPDEVTDVFLTHFHGDHVGGLLGAGGKALLPKATVWASEAENKYWLKDGANGRGQSAAEKIGPYRRSGRYKLFKPGEIKPGVEAVELYGHTPGHVGFLFAAGGDREFLAWGDVVHAYLLQFSRPEISMSYDVDQKEAAATRAKIFAKAAESGYLTAGAHLPFPGLGQVKKGPGGQGSSYVWEKR